jgi:hypothetical protein
MAMIMSRLPPLLVIVPRFVSVVLTLEGIEPIATFNPPPATVRFPFSDKPPKKSPPGIKWLKARVVLPETVVEPVVVKTPELGTPKPQPPMAKVPVNAGYAFE